MAFLKSIKLSGFLSFPPDAEAIPLTPLNVIIGPNGSGKSNLIEAIGLLSSASKSSLATAIRQGGGATEWLWKGDPKAERSSIDITLGDTPWKKDLRYQLAFAPAGQRMEVVEETIEDAEPSDENSCHFYRYQGGSPEIRTTHIATTTTDPNQTVTAPVFAGGMKSFLRTSLVPDESVLSQRKDQDLYPELFWLNHQFNGIQVFNNWSFGRLAPMRAPQRTDLDGFGLLPNAENLGLVLNEFLLNGIAEEFNRHMASFLPRYRRFNVRVYGNSLQLYLIEDGLASPVPATRLSDGTIRFMAILALLLSPNPPPLLCIDEPEMGLHPDAVSRLADLLVEASSRMQLIVTTHSDALVSALTTEVESILVCDNIRGTTFERMNRDRLAHWLEDYRLGEVWRMGAMGGNP